MSHITKTKTKLTDVDVIKKAATALGLKSEKVKDYKFYDGTIASGMSVQLPNWRYPVVIAEDGEVFFDNYEGSWGDEVELDKFKQQYSAETLKKVARKKGMTLKETRLEDGKLQLVTV